MNKFFTIRNGVLCLLVLMIPLSICYYYFYPRYALGYSKVKVSKYAWDSAFERAFDRRSSFYYHRFDNDYNYKAFLIARYDDFIRVMNDGKGVDPSVVELVGWYRTDISDNDRQIIESAVPRYREQFLQVLRTWNPSDRLSEYMAPFLVAYCFTRYYNEAHDNLPMDRNEFATIYQWLKQRDKELKAHLVDPYNLRKSDFDTENTELMLEWKIGLGYGAADFLRDMKYYEDWVERFCHFCDTFNE